MKKYILLLACTVTLSAFSTGDYHAPPKKDKVEQHEFSSCSYDLSASDALEFHTYGYDFIAPEPLVIAKIDTKFPVEADAKEVRLFDLDTHPKHAKNIRFCYRC